MAVSEDVMELVRLLDDEGFGALAGEILTEISLGREVVAPEGDPTEEAKTPGSDAPRPDAPSSEYVEVDEGVFRKRLYADLDGGRGDPVPERVPIAEPEQLAFAVEMVRLRVVQPARRMAEAERLAGGLGKAPRAAARSEAEGVADGGTGASDEGATATPVRIVFQERPDVTARDSRGAPAGSTVEVDELDAALSRLAEGG